MPVRPIPIPIRTALRWRAGALHCLLRVAVLLLAGAATLPGTAAAAELDIWRAEATRVRRLAESNAPAAHEAARALQAQLPKDAPPADRARALNLLARIEIYRAETPRAGEHAQQALDLARQHGDRIGQAEAQLNIALNSINEGRLTALITSTTESLALLDGVDRPELLGEALLRTAMMYRRMGQVEESVAMTLQSMEIARRGRDPLVMAYAHQGLAISYDQSERADLAREHYGLMREQARAAGSRLLEGYAVGGLGGAAGKLGDLAAAERLQREAIGIYQEVGAPFGVAFGRFGLADILRKHHHDAEAVPVLDEAMAIYEQHPNRIGQWYTLNARSEARQALGQVAAAHADAERAYALARDIAFPLYLSESARRLGGIAAAKGDLRRAYELSTEAAEMSARAAREGASQRLLELSRRFEAESRQRGIAELTRRSEQQQAELRQQALYERWLWTVLSASLLLLAATLYFFGRLRRSHGLAAAANARLQQSEQEVRALNAGLEQRVQSRTLEVHQQARYLRTLLDLLPLAAWLKDAQGRYLVTNQAHAARRGCSVAEIEGRTDSELLSGPHAHSLDDEDAEVRATRQRRTVERPEPGPDGPVWLESYKAPVLDDDGSVLGTVGAERDISDRKSADAAREAALEEARRLARMRSEFLAQMSHELRTPLNGILGFAQLLQMDATMDDRRRRGLGVIEQSGRHLLALINDILDVARIDAGKLELQPSQVDLPALLNTVADIVRVKADERELLFRLDLPPALPGLVWVDDKRLRQVLLNLLSNAVKFTDRGHVVLRVRWQHQHADGMQPQARLRFEVEDTGPGLSAAQRERLFEPFEQVGEARQREGGSGLGLAISRELVRRMGGDIDLNSTPGAGSTFGFTLDLPVAAVRSAPQTDLASVAGYEGPRHRVLVVDDVPQNLALLVECFSTLGFEVDEAADGLAAIACAQACRPDLIVMDVTMPVLDGLAATRRLRSMPELAAVPIIASSANSSGRTEGDSLAAGANAFIAKPIDQHALLALVGQLLQLRWVRRSEADAVVAG